MVEMNQVMPRYRSRMAGIRPVNRIKHVIDANGVISTTQIVVDLVVASDTPTIGAITTCETGSKVNGIYLKVECTQAAGSSLSNVYLAVMKQPGSGVVPPQANAVGASVFKKFIIHQEMVMLGDSVENMPRVIFNGVIKIPKGYQRNGPLDKIMVLLLAGTSNTYNFCLQAHYKEFR